MINSYTLVFGGFLLLGGRAGDLFGRKRIFLAGVVIFTVASLANGLSQSGGMLIACRALQGLGAALVSPAALSIITTTFAEGEDRAKALGVWSAIAAGGAAFGLLLGGILTDLLSWEWIFFVNVPIGIAAFVLSLRYVPESVAPERPDTVDLPGAISVTAGLMVLVFALVKAQDYGWGSARTLGLGAVAVALLAAFVFIESRSKAPLIRLGIFRSRNISGANAVMLLVIGGMYAFFFLVSLYVQQVLGYSPLEAGLAFLPFTLGIIVGAGVSQPIAQADPRALHRAHRDRARDPRPRDPAGRRRGRDVPRQPAAGHHPDVDRHGHDVPAADARGDHRRLRRRTPASPRACSTRRSRWAARSAWRSCRRSPPRTRRACSTASAAAPTAQQRAEAVVEGFQVAYLGGIGLLVLGAIVLVAVLRTRDMAAVAAAEGQPVAVGA